MGKTAQSWGSDHNFLSGSGVGGRSGFDFFWQSGVDRVQFPCIGLVLDLRTRLIVRQR